MVKSPPCFQPVYIQAGSSILDRAFASSQAHTLKNKELDRAKKMSTHDLFSIYIYDNKFFSDCLAFICELGYMMEWEINGVL